MSVQERECESDVHTQSSAVPHLFLLWVNKNIGFNEAQFNLQL